VNDAWLLALVPAEVKTLRERQAMTQKRLQQIKERVKKAVTSQFQDIIDEVSQDESS